VRACVCMLMLIRALGYLYDLIVVVSRLSMLLIYIFFGDCYVLMRLFVTADTLNIFDV